MACYINGRPYVITTLKLLVTIIFSAFVYKHQKMLVKLNVVKIGSKNKFVIFENVYFTR